VVVVLQDHERLAAEDLAERRVDGDPEDVTIDAEPASPGARTDASIRRINIHGNTPQDCDPDPNPNSSNEARKHG
jgi:hypothetical protein